MPLENKVLLIDEPHPLLVERLQAMGFSLDFHYRTPREELLPALGAYVGVVVRSRLAIDREWLERSGQLRFVARLGVGVEHIDLEAAAELDIAVFTSPEGSRDTVAEHTLGLLLMLLNNLGRADREVRQGQWRREPNRGVELKGKTVGILGYGNMGSAFARRLAGMECQVIAYDKFKSDYGDAYALEVDLPEFFAESDIVSLHIPFLPENYHFVNDAFIRSFHKNIFLVNTARGTVLNTEDLVRNLQNGKVLGAALDVIEYEEQSFAHLDPALLPAPFQYLVEAGNTVLSPHIAGWSRESMRGHAQTLADKIARYFGFTVPVD